MKILVAVAVVVLVFLISGQTQAQEGGNTYLFGNFADGKVIAAEKDHIVWVGEFSGANFNTKGSGFMHNTGMRCPGLNHIKDGTAQADGYCILTDGEGDIAVSRWECSGPAMGSCVGTFKWLSGTGKYATLKGGGRIYGGASLPNGTGYTFWSND